MMPHNPNRKPFPRGYAILPFLPDTKVHLLYRENLEEYFKTINPSGYYHDLGAMDVFLDNFGMLVAEQFKPIDLVLKYSSIIILLLRYWECLKSNVIQRKPYYGKYFNSKVRTANSGEPRGLIRFLGESDLSKMSTIMNILGIEEKKLFTNDQEFLKYFMRGHRDHEERSVVPNMLPGILEKFGKGVFNDQYRDFNFTDLFPNGFLDNSSEDDSLQSRQPFCCERTGGVILPIKWSKEVDRIRILHPKESTPDLPLKVGMDNDRDRKIYLDSLRNQGNLGTCVSHAVCMGLNVLVRRLSRRNKVHFSPAWLHLDTGDCGNSGRILSDAIKSIKKNLPCSEEKFSYNPDELRLRDSNSPPWKTSDMVRDSEGLSAKFGPPWVREIDPKDIKLIKTHLAAGWIVIVSTSFTKEFLGGGFYEFGLPLSPIIGQKRSSSAHAWLFIGYQHVDGNQQWKYQGRFIALNSWGKEFPRNPKMDKGICTIPFGMLLTEGIEAFALRFTD